MPIEITDPLQRAVDDVVREWPDVKAKSVFGHRGYVRGRKMFAFLANGGIALKIGGEDELTALYLREGVEPFAYNGMPMRQWPVLPLGDEDGLSEALTLARRAYEAVE